MGKLAQQLGGQSQVKVCKTGGAVTKKAPAKKTEKYCGGGMVKKGKK